MSNSIKQSKFLLEGWRKFYLKEAEESSVKEGKVVRIFDFDGTLRLSPKEFPLLDNPFFMTNITPYAKSLITKNEKIQQNMKINEELKDLIRPTDYVISSIASSGLPKGKNYFFDLVKKGDALATDFLKNYLQIDISKIKEPKDLEKYFLLAPTEEQEELPVTTERSEEIQKKQIKSFLKSQYGVTLPDDHILIGTNVAKTDSEGKVIKGTSGKVMPAEEVYKSLKDKEAKIELYDNSTVGLAQVRKGLLAAKSGEEEAPEAEDIETSEKMSVSEAISKVKELYKALQAEKSLGLKSYIVGADGKVAPYTKPYSLSKKGPGEKSAERTYQTLKNLLASLVYSNGVIVPNVGTPPKEPTSARAKAVHDFLMNNGMSVSADTLKRVAGKRASLPEAGPLVTSAETNNKFVEELGQIVQKREEIKRVADQSVSGAVVEKPAEKPAEKVKAEPEQKIKSSARPAAISGEEGADEADIMDAAIEDDDLAWDEMSDSAKRKYRIEYRKKKASLRETILKELKPLLKQLNGVLSHPKLNKK